MLKINTNVRDVVCDTYYFLINFLILVLLLVGELSTLTLSFNSPTIILITLFTLLRSNSGFSLTADFVRLIWYSLPLVEYIPSGVYMIKCHSVPVVSAGMGQCPRKISMSWTCPGHCPVQVSRPNIPLYSVIIKDSN